MKALIAVLAGDGIGGEVTDEAVRALERVAARFGHGFGFETALIGGAAIDATGEALPAATLALARRADAILLGAVGGPKWSAPDAAVRPEQGLLQLRKALGLFANLRPVVPHPAVLHASPIKAEYLRGVDIMVVRELTGGIYFGEKSRTATEAVDVCRYSVEEIERVVRLAAQPGPRPPPQTHLNRQGQCARDLAPLAHGGRADHARRISGRELRAHAGGFGRDASAQAAARLRRDRDGEHVRRHSHRRSLHAGGLAWGCCRRRRSARRPAAGCSSPSMDRRRTSPGAASPIPTPRY